MILALFDVDGTLVNAGGAGREALCRAFETEFGSVRVMEKAADVRFDGRTDKEIIAEIGARAGVAPEDLAGRRETFERAYVAILEEMLREEGRARPLPGAADLLAALRSGGAHLGLVTGNIRAGARAKLEAAGLGSWFEDGAWGSDSEDRAELARLARERFESRLGGVLRPGGIVLAGDSRADVRAARENGFRSLAVETGWTRREDLVAAGADRVVADLSDTAGLAAWILGED